MKPKSRKAIQTAQAKANGLDAGHAPLPPGVLPPQLAVHENRSSHGLSQQVLRTDVAGMPLEWIDYKEAVRLYHMDQVAY